MFGVGKMFNVLERSVLCSPRLNLFDQKYCKNNNIVKYYHLKKFNILIYIIILMY